MKYSFRQIRMTRRAERVAAEHRAIGIPGCPGSANVVRHAPPPVTATVVIRYDDEGVVVEVTDDGRGNGNKRSHGGGHGLAGMRERVSLLGGELSTGPGAGGGYRVVARVPAQAGAQ
jgi:glucose-6-phosphate-specific signal transduction histidine kinase